MKQMKRLTFEEHRARINNMREVEEGVKSCLFRHRTSDYMLGQVFYHLGYYPYKFSMEPTEYDYNIFKELKDKGVELIQTHSELTDTMRFWGADKFTPVDSEGLHHFVSALHENDLKMIPYFSSSFFQVTDPDFTDAFVVPEAQKPLVELYFNLHHCRGGSPEWLDYFLPRIEKFLDDYGFDGLYNDMGSPDLYPADDPTEQRFNEDLMYRLYNMVKSRGGIMKAHYSAAIPIPYDEKVYDYYWVGEGLKDYSGFKQARTHKPYIVPVIDSRFISDEDPDEQFAHFIPFMQFPMLKYGRPYLLNIGEAPEGALAWADEPCTHHKLKIQEYYTTHPNGLYCYSEWSAIPDNPKARETWFKYLALYKEMVEEGSVCHANITDSSFVLSEYSEDIIVSMFTNEKMYMVVSNLSDKPYEIKLSKTWTNRLDNTTSDTFTIQPNKLIFLTK